MNGFKNIGFGFRNSVFQVSLDDLAMSDCRIGFHVKNCAYSQREMSGNPKFGPDIAKTVSRRLQPAIHTVFDVESDSALRNRQILHENVKKWISDISIVYFSIRS